MIDQRKQSTKDGAKQDEREAHIDYGSHQAREYAVNANPRPMSNLTQSGAIESKRRLSRNGINNLTAFFDEASAGALVECVEGSAGHGLACSAAAAIVALPAAA